MGSCVLEHKLNNITRSSSVKKLGGGRWTEGSVFGWRCKRATFCVLKTIADWLTNTSSHHHYLCTPWLTLILHLCYTCRPFVGAPYSYAYGRSTYQLQYKTIGDILEDLAARGVYLIRLVLSWLVTLNGTDDGRPFIISHHEGLKKTSTDLLNDSRRVANALHSKLGIQKGDVVGLWSLNTYNWVYCAQFN